MDWFELRKVEELNQLIDRQVDDPNFGFALFKHSTRCSISALAKKRLEISWKGELEEVPIYLVNLIANRDLSNEIAERFQVRHESPQILFIKNSKAVYHASHLSISSKEILKHN